MTQREGPFQTELRKYIEYYFPGAIVSKQDSSYQQGIPDLAVFLDHGFYALLEVKRDSGATTRPNQEYFIERAKEMSFGAIVHPGNMFAVLEAMGVRYHAHVKRIESLRRSAE